MKKSFFHKWWSPLIFIVVIALVMGGSINQLLLEFNNNNTSTEEKIQENNQNENMLSIKQMKEDLQSVKSSVLSHPYFKNDSLKEEYNKYFQSLINKIDKPMNNEDFYFMVNEALIYLKDSHTFVQPYGEENKELPLNFIWLYNNDMIIKDDNEYLKKGDKILSISSKTPEQILDELRSLASAENDYWIKVLGEKRLTMEIYLNKMQLVENEQVSMKVEHIDGKVEDINLKLIQKNDNSDRVNNKREKNYEIFPDKNIGVIYIDIVGEPTGNAPNFYGHTGKRTLINSKIKYMISSRAFISPSEDSNINLVQPHVLVCMTREDIVSGIDPALEWVLNNK